MRVLLIALCFAILPSAGLGSDLQTLIDAGRLSIESRLLPEEPVVPGQKTLLEITIATDRWFAAGTRIRLPEVPGLVILQTRSFATNSSERRSGSTWVVQRWYLDLYASRPGHFVTGPVALELAVNTGEGVVRGHALAPSVSLSAQLPPALAHSSGWIASSDFSISQSLEPRHRQLVPGAAITRTLVFQARDVLDKMLPAPEFDSPPGLGTYPAPAQLELSSNRGVNVARRTQSVTYVAEQAGNYTLPGYSFDWWDTRTQELRELVLEPVELVVQAAPAKTTRGISLPAWQKAALLATLLLGTVAGLVGWRHKEAATGALRAAGDWLCKTWQQHQAPQLEQKLNDWRSLADTRHSQSGRRKVKCARRGP